MKSLPLLLLGASVATLTACSTGRVQAPYATTYPATEQRKMQAAHHWDVLAQYEAGRILSAVKDHTRPIYVERPGAGASPFALAYHEMLTEHLVDGGGLVVTRPMAAGVQVSYDTQVLTHRDRGYTQPTPGTYTLIGGTALLAGYAAQNWANPELALFPVLLGADIFSGSHAVRGPTEVIITTRVTKGNLVVASDTDQFYFNAGDMDHYMNRVALHQGQVFKVVGQ